MEPHTVGTPRTFGYVNQELIVKTAQVDAIRAHFGLRSDAKTEIFGSLTRIRSPQLVSVYDKLAGLSTDQARAVAPNYTLQPWVSSGGAGWPEPSTAAPVIADRVKSGGTTVAVFDSGLIEDWTVGHPQLVQVELGTGTGDLVPDRGDGNPMRLFDCHGTFVAGVLGCAAPDARVLVSRVFDDDGGTDDWSLAQAIDAFLAGNPEVRVVNLSCGTFADPAHPPLALLDVVQRHGDVLFVAAAGNLPAPAPAAVHGYDASTIRPAVAGAEAATGRVVVTGGTSDATSLPAYPAGFPEVIGVGSALPGGTPAPFTDLASTDVWALGVDVHNAFGSGWVAGPPGGDSVGPFGGTATWRGTSFAAPLAAGLLAGWAAEVGKLPANHGPIATLAMDWLRAHTGNSGDPSGPIKLPYPSA
jgi:Subtilase family